MSIRQLLHEIVRVELKQLVREIIQEEREGIQKQQPRREIVAAYIPPKSRSTYKGDSQAKKSVRLRVWESIKQTLGSVAFSKGPHVFLASKEGGDASTLRGLGVSDEAILAVDSDPAAVREFERKYPGIPNRNIDIAYAMSDLEQKPTSIFLDFSSQVSSQILLKVRVATQNITPGGVIACTFAIGREKRWNGSGVAPCEERIRMLEDFMEGAGVPYRVLNRFRYTSESMSGPGSSLMFVVVFHMTTGQEAPEAALKEIGIQDLYRDVYRHKDNPELHWLINCPEHKAEALRSRIKAYPPPRVI